MPDLHDLVKQIVLKQTHRYIMELLRSHDLPIGRTPAEFEKNVLDAVDSGKLTAAHIVDWLSEVYGWGNHFVYPYRVSARQAADWSTPRRVTNRVRRAKLDRYLQEREEDPLSAPFDFPDHQPMLSSIYPLPEGCGVGIDWHEGRSAWDSQTDRSYYRRRGLDYYRFVVSRLLATRAIMRFELRCDPPRAALFVPFGLGAAHQGALEGALAVIDQLGLGPVVESRLALSPVARRLDGAIAEGRQGGVTTRTISYAHGSSKVTFSSVEGAGLTGPIGGSRMALQPDLDDLEVPTASFDVDVAGHDADQSRLVLVRTDADRGRGAIRAHLSRPEVWAALLPLFEHQDEPQAA